MSIRIKTWLRRACSGEFNRSTQEGVVMIKREGVNDGLRKKKEEKHSSYGPIGRRLFQAVGGAKKRDKHCFFGGLFWGVGLWFFGLVGGGFHGKNPYERSRDHRPRNKARFWDYREIREREEMARGTGRQGAERIYQKTGETPKTPREVEEGGYRRQTDGLMGRA